MEDIRYGEVTFDCHPWQGLHFAWNELLLAQGWAVSGVSRLCNLCSTNLSHSMALATYASEV